MTARLRLLYLSAASLLFCQPTKVWAQLTYQAESAQLAGGARTGSSGGVSYAEYITQRGTVSVPGSSVTFTSVSASEAKTYAVEFRYAAARPHASSLSIYVNGADVTQALFPSTRAWNLWTTHTVPLNLRAGSNTIMVRYDADDNGWINLDYILVKPESVSVGYKLGAAPTAGWFPQEISVDKFTGTAQVYLPLHTVQANGISVPIGLAYSATGVQVDDKGGKVGVNWALTGEVSISREVRGLPDDRVQTSAYGSRYGWLVYPAGTSSPSEKVGVVPDAPTSISAPGCTPNESIAREKLDEIGNLQPSTGARVLYDSEPDIFHYSLPGHSGKFVFDAQKRVRTIPYDHITITHTIDPTIGITSFTIRTADGTTYFFNISQKVSKTLVNETANPNFFLREHRLYKFPSNFTTFDYNYSWLASTINTSSGETVQFEYSEIVSQPNPSISSRRLLRGQSSGFGQGSDVGVEEYITKTTTDQRWLKAIISSTTRINFNMVTVQETSEYGDLVQTGYFVQSVEVLSNAPSNATIGHPLIRRYLFEYLNAEPTINGHGSNGRQILGPNRTRRFLRSVRVTNGCSTQPLYEFAYSQLKRRLVNANGASYMMDFVPLPLVGANERDYWGFYTVNHSLTLIPKLFVYPQLLAQPQVVPGAPYRLFETEVPATAAGGFVLAGAERRPAAYFNFQAALAGTLTSVTLPAGGKAYLEYDAHRFYDPVAQQSYPAGGTRIRAIRVQDPITGIEARRDYGYQEDNGSASGVLLQAPRFAFMLPSTAAPGQAQWTAATVRCGDDLSKDPFETRAIGYRQVTEQMMGKGQVVTLYHVPGSADESTAADGTAAGIEWSRAVMGVARNSSASTCPSVAPLQAGTDLYPFAPATNYDFRRGLVQSVVYKAEPVGAAAPLVVRRETFAYTYRDLKPTWPPVVGLSYELLSREHNTYAYAKYPILTDFLYAIRHQTEVIPNGSVANNQSDTWYNYNAQGWLSAQGKTNSDGKGYRTRYKYLTDYPLTGTAAEPRLQAMQQRFSLTGEKISATPIETISEVVISPSEVRFAGATLNTFIWPAGQNALTRPHQVLRWQPAVPLAIPYDSTRVEPISGGLGLRINPNFRVASTLLQTTPQLVPLSTRTEAGRQLSALHLGYGSTMPVLNIANALASEVVFSDFESAKSFEFTLSADATVVKEARRTGQAGTLMESNASLSTSLPASTARSFRLSFWARPVSAATAASITVSIIGGGALPAPRTVAASTNGAWQFHELVFDLNIPASSPLSAYTLQLLSNGRTYLDDVLFLPTNAVAASTTYDLTKGKTSETDGRGRTVFYDYNAVGGLARVRDHNGAIVKQMEKVIAGRVPETIPSFGVSGRQEDGQPVMFTAFASCGNNLEYSWDFGDGASLAFPALTGVTHPFNTAGQVRTFVVTLTARIIGQSKVYRSVQGVEIRPVPVSVVSCFNGVKSIDLCEFDADVLVNYCDPGNLPAPAPSPRPTTNAYSVQSIAGAVYTWRTVTVGTPPSVMPVGNVSAITVGLDVYAVEQPTYQCTITDASGAVLGVSEVFSLQCYRSRGTAATPCQN